MFHSARFLPVIVVFVLALFFIFYPQAQTLNLFKSKPQDTTISCCRAEDVLKSNGNFDYGAVSAVFNNQPVVYPKDMLAQISTDEQNSVVLGATTTSDGQEKWIDVSLSEQRVRAYEGNTVVREFSISSGRWAPTPTGTFYIWYKTRFQRMTGGSKELGDFYDLPNVPYNMFFHDGFALHGAYWHNNFGTPMSHGCVNEPLADAKWMFDWAGPKVPDGQNWVRATDDNPGTKVVVHN